MPQPFKPFPPKRRSPSSLPLADLVGPCIGAALGKHGFGESDILMHWPEIVGAALADRCQPLRLQWRQRVAADANAKTEPATLIVRVESAFAVTLQHMGMVIVERVNTYLGWRCVGRIALKQGPLPRIARKPPPVPAPDPLVMAEARHLVEYVEDDGLRDALAKLGGRVLHQPASAPTVAKPHPNEN